MTVLSGSQLTTRILEFESVAGTNEPGLMAVCLSDVKSFAKAFWVIARGITRGLLGQYQMFSYSPKRKESRCFYDILIL